jgi:hypothetical protein
METSMGTRDVTCKITTPVCINMDRWEKKLLLVSGNSEKPRSFKHIKSLPCIYRQQ